MSNLFLILALCWSAAAAAVTTHTLAVVPQYTPVDTGMRWGPLIRRLEQESGLRLQLRVQDRFDRFERELDNGLPDFAFMNPWHAVTARRSQGYIPLARSGRPLSGVLVVHRDGPIQSLADLNHREVAFPAPHAFVASMLLGERLREKENLQFRAVYAGTHQNVYRHVLLGIAAAGGGGDMTLEREPESVRSRLKVLYSTPGVAPHPLAAHPRVPEESRRRMTDALLRLQQDEEGRGLLAGVGLDAVRTADYQRDYAPLERLRGDASGPR